MVNLYLYIISVMGLLVCFVMIERFFIKKSIKTFKELKEAYQDLKKSKEDLEKFLK